MEVKGSTKSTQFFFLLKLLMIFSRLWGTPEFTLGEVYLQLDHDSEFMPNIFLDDSLKCSTWGIRLAM